MKRLLAYLFIVLGLGLTFNVNAEAKDPTINVLLCSTKNNDRGIIFRAWDREDKKSIFFGENEFNNPETCSALGYPKIVNWENFPENNKIICYKKEFTWTNKVFQPSYAQNCEQFKNYNQQLKYVSYENGVNKFTYGKTQTQIAKAEPSQTQKVAKSETTVKLVFKGQYVCLEGDTNCGKYSPSGPISFNKWKSRKSSFNKNGLCMSPEFGTVFYLHTIDNCDHYEKTYSIKYYRLTNLKNNVFKIDGYIGKVAIKNFDDPTGQGEGSSVVAKKESLKNFQFKCENKFNDRIIQAKYDDKLNHLFYVDGKTYTPAIEGIQNGKAKILAKSDRFIIFQIRTDYFVGNRVLDIKKKQVLSLKGTSTEKKDAINFFKSNGYFNVSLKSQATCIEDETQIAKAEPTVKPKKKAKVVKKEPKQEEFKPKKTNQDNEAPVITIAEAITVDSQAYTLKGKVKDKSRFQLTIDDRPIKVAKNGQFEFEGFAIDSKEQLKIVAIDRWKNKSEKIINVEVKIKQVADLRSYEKPNPSKIKVKKDNNKIGIIIGIEKYQNLNNIDAPYANRDAKAFKAYANIALGIPNNNLKVLIDEDATRGELLKSLKIWLPQITRGKEKDIYIFFAGHGLASDDGKDLHILPHNGDPILLEDTALSRIQMFDLINKVSPKSVTMFFDTCYSGQTRSEQMLVAGLRPVRIVADEQDTPNNFTIFTASNYDQTSGSINEAEHGIFSYYLMKGLEGNADANKDKKLTNGELIAYLKNNVSQEAFIQNRSQEPMLAGDPGKILMSYR